MTQTAPTSFRNPTSIRRCSRTPCSRKKMMTRFWPTSFRSTRKINKAVLRATRKTSVTFTKMKKYCSNTIALIWKMIKRSKYRILRCSGKLCHMNRKNHGTNDFRRNLNKRRILKFPRVQPYLEQTWSCWCLKGCRPLSNILIWSIWSKTTSKCSRTAANTTKHYASIPWKTKMTEQWKSSKST